MFNAACLRRAELHNTRASPGLAEIEQRAEHILSWHTEDCKPPLHKVSKAGFDSKAQSTWLHQKPAWRLLYFLSSVSAITCHTSVNVSSASVPTKLLDWAAFNLVYHMFGCVDPVLVMLYVLHWPNWQKPCQRICNGAVSLLTSYILRCVWWPFWVFVNRLMQAAAADLLGRSTTYPACQVAQIATYSADNSRSRSTCHIITAIALYLG